MQLIIGNTPYFWYWKLSFVNYLNEVQICSFSCVSLDGQLIYQPFYVQSQMPEILTNHKNSEAVNSK